MAGKEKGTGRRGKPELPGDLGSLKERYRTILVEKLTREDLRELQSLLRNEVDARGNLDRKARDRFEWILRGYLHEEILTREITGIEALIRGLKPGDLKK